MYGITWTSCRPFWCFFVLFCNVRLLASQFLSMALLCHRSRDLPSWTNICRHDLLLGLNRCCYCRNGLYRYIVSISGFIESSTTPMSVTYYYRSHYRPTPPSSTTILPSTLGAIPLVQCGNSHSPVFSPTIPTSLLSIPAKSIHLLV